jgi:hypothetical protein
VHQPGTWRRLKIAFELRLGHGLPRLPEIERIRLAGLLAAVRDGQAKEALDDDAEQERRGRIEMARPGVDLDELCRSLAKSVDVRPLL